MLVRNLLAIACLALAACGQRATKGAIDPAMARCIPAGAQALAGMDLDRLGTMAGSIRLRLGAPEGTRTMLAAEIGQDILIIAGGDFSQPPANATMIAPGVAALGSSSAVAQAAAQYRSGAASGSTLLSRGEGLARSAPLWAAMQGGVTLPLSGNLANLNRFLRMTDYTTLTVQPGEQYLISITGICANTAGAEQLERTLRGFLALAGAARAKMPGGVQIRLQDREVHVTLAAGRDAVEALFH